MAQKKANTDWWFDKCCREAKEIVKRWIANNQAYIDQNSLRVVWLAFVPNGFRAMISSKSHSNKYFEVTKYFRNNETTITCYDRYAYSVFTGELACDITIDKKPKHLASSTMFSSTIFSNPDAPNLID
jgi:hypothetical protein